MLDSHVPGLAFGIVANGRLVHLETMGTADPRTGAPVTADTRFRIASMSKAFTGLSILTLSAEGKLNLDAPAASIVPEMAGWGADIRISDLLFHQAGFVTDDPWGDRQQPLPEAEFSRMIRKGVPFNRPPRTAFEYSNFGYALLGRIVSNVSGMTYQQFIRGRFLQPLGMTATTHDVLSVPPAQLANGFRWQEGAWVPEPVMPDGAFGAMGGVVTTPADYARWIAFLLSGWPAGGTPATLVSPLTLRGMAAGTGLPQLRTRPGATGATACKLAAGYGAGLIVARDCDLGLALFHGGGYPGYGSHMLLLPEAGVGLFTFTNRTYAGVTGPLWDAALALKAAGALPSPAISTSPALATAYRGVTRIWAEGRIAAEPALLAENMLLDRPERLWTETLAELRTKVGACDTSAPVQPSGALAGSFTWRCATGRIEGRILLAPTPEPQIQALSLAVAGS
jgi:CubicO group peptidase (beta-lactamase class C family)